MSNLVERNIRALHQAIVLERARVGKHHERLTALEQQVQQLRQDVAQLRQFVTMLMAKGGR